MQFQPVSVYFSSDQKQRNNLDTSLFIFFKSKTRSWFNVINDTVNTIHMIKPPWCLTLQKS